MQREPKERIMQERKLKSFPVKSRIAYRRKEVSCHSGQKDEDGAE